MNHLTPLLRAAAIALMALMIGVSCSRPAFDARRAAEFAQDFSRGLADGLNASADSTDEITLHISDADYNEFATAVIIADTDSATDRRTMDINVRINDLQTAPAADDDFDFTGALAISAGIGMCIIAILVPVFIVLVICIYIFRIRRDRNRLITHAIDHGYRLPDSFWADPAENRPVRLQSAVSFLACGIGIFCFFICLGAKAVAMLGLIPAIIGIGRLIAYFIQRHDARTTTLPPVTPSDNGTSDDK